MKKLLSMMLVLLVFGLTLAGCKSGNDTVDCKKNPDHQQCQTEKDSTKPLLRVAPTDVTIMYDEDYDLMTGVDATDNKEGNITSKVTIEIGDYSNKVPGQYVITYKVSDLDGNETTATRNITVLEKMPSVVVDGKKYGMIYNPILNPKFLMGNSLDANNNAIINPWHFDLTKVSVFSKDYFDWLYTNYPNRLYAGWTNIAVTDSEGKIVLLRDHNCNQYTADGGIQVCSDWSNGTQPNDYKDLHAGLANLPVPDGGHVVVFINDGKNETGSPRSFGDALMAGGSGLGKTIIFQNPEVIVDHANNQLPVISIPEANFTKEVIVGESFNVMEGVTVTDKENPNVTLETKITKYDGTNYVEVNEVTTTEPSTYIIEYSADYDGFRKVMVRRQVVVKSDEAPVEKFLSLGESKIKVVENPVNWTVDGVHLYTKEYWDNNVASMATNSYQWALVAVTDEYGRIIEVRGSWGGPFLHYTLKNPNGVAPDTSVWGSVSADWKVEMITNLTVPEGGFVIGFGHASGTNEYRAWAYRHLITDHEFDETNNSADPQQYANLSPINKVFSGEWFKECVTFNGQDILVVSNTERWKEYYNVKGGQLYTKEFWDTIDQSQLLYIGEGNMYQYSIVIVLDKTGKIVEIRDAIPDGAFEYTEANPSGVAATKWASNTPTKDLVVPDGGFVLAFYVGKEDAYKLFVNTTGAEGVTDVNAIGTRLEGKWFKEYVEEDYITFNGQDILVVQNPENWQAYHTVNGSHLYTKEYWDAIDQSQLVGIPNGNLYQYSVIVVLDQFGKVVEIRDALATVNNDLGFVYNEANPTGIEATWTRQTPTDGLVVPDGGYVLAFTTINNTDTTWRTAGYKAFVRTSGDHSVDKGTTDVNAVGQFVEGKWFKDHITFNGQDILVVKNPENWQAYHTVNGSHLYTKEYWDAIDQSQLVGIPNGNLYQYSVIVVLDSTGKVVEIRDALATVNNDLGFVYNEANPTGIEATWTRQTPTEGLVVPDGGYVLAFTTINNTDTTWRTAGYKAFVRTSGDHTVDKGTTDVNAVGQFVEGKWFKDHITFNGQDILVVKNPEDWQAYYTVNGSHLYTKEYWDAVDQTQLVNIPVGNFYKYSLIVVLDNTGKVVEIRDALAKTGAEGENLGFEFTETNPTGIASSTWDRETPTNGLVVPDGGYVLVFTGIGTDYTWRTAGYTAFVHTSGSHTIGLGTTDVNAVGQTVILPE